MKKIGRFERFASSSPVSQVVYQAIPASPTACGLGITFMAPLGPCAQQVEAKMNKAQIDNAKEVFMAWPDIFKFRCVCINTRE
jgi:hypothetical protein